MIVDWEKLTGNDLLELGRIAEETCGFEVSAIAPYSGEIRGVVS